MKESTRFLYPLSIPQQSLDIHQPSAPLFAAAAAVVIIMAVVVVVRDSISYAGAAIIMMAENDNGTKLIVGTE